MDERDTCGRCGRDTSCFVIVEVFCFQIGKSLLIKRNLLIRCSLQFEMSKQNLHTRGCMLRSKRGEWKKAYTHCAKGKPLKWTCIVKNLMWKMHEAKSCLDKYWSAHRVVLEISGPLGKFCWIASQCFLSSATDWQPASLAMTHPFDGSQVEDACCAERTPKMKLIVSAWGGG